MAVVDRSALASSESRFPFLLAERGREGLFVFDSSNLIRQVAADPNQAMYIPPASDPSGASGAWSRKHSGAVNVQWFGAVADGDTAKPTNNGPAFLAAIALLKALAISGHGFSEGSLSLYVPAGVYYLGKTTLDLAHSLIVFGDNTGDATGGASVLKWAGNTTGIRVQAGNTIGARGTKQPSSSSGTGSLIRNLMLIGGYSSADADYHGIHLRARATIRDVYIEGFPGDGIYINASAGSGGSTEGNANNTEVARVFIENCQSGLYIEGLDANAGLFAAVNVRNCRAWGVWDSSFLGNTHIAHHVAGCASGPYKTDSHANKSVFVGCYSEGGQPPASLFWPTLVVGGTHGAGFDSFESTRLLGDQIAANENLVSSFGDLRSSRYFRLHPKARSLKPTIDFAGGGSYEVDGHTPLSIAQIRADWDTLSPATTKGLMYFATRTYAGGGSYTDRMILDGINLTLRPATDNSMDCGLTAARWKNIFGYAIDAKTELRVNSTKVVGARGAAVPNASHSAATPTKAEFDALVDTVNTLLARLRAATGHGLIA